jgi:hypothetical protein
MARFYEGGKSVLSFRGKFFTGKVYPRRERWAQDDFSLGEILYQAHLSRGKV